MANKTKNKTKNKTNVALDYFRTLFERQGRNNLKRYGCMFSCLATCVMHLEVIEDLTTEAFLMVYRWLPSLAGEGTQVISFDNGSNFVGSHSEMKRWLAGIDKQWIMTAISQRGTE